MLGKIFLIYVPTSSDDHYDSFKEVIIIDKCQTSSFSDDENEIYEDIYVTYDRYTYAVYTVLPENLIMFISKSLDKEVVESFKESLIATLEDHQSNSEDLEGLNFAEKIEALVEKFMIEDGLSKEKALSKAHKTLFGNDVD